MEREYKEPLRSIGVPESLYRQVREDAFVKDVTMVSIVTSILRRRYPVKPKEVEAK